MRCSLIRLFISVGLLGFAASASAARYSIEALYNAPGGGTATVTGIYDDAGYTGVGTEQFIFIEADLVFSAGGSLLHDTSHTVTDMFGIAFQGGTPVDLINHGNTEPNGKSKLIFSSAEAPDYPGSLGIYMSDSGSAMLVEGWWITNHQGAQAHTLSGFSGPTLVPLPAVVWLFGLVVAGLANCRRRT